MPAEIFLLLAIISSASVSLILKLFSEPKGSRFGLFLGNYLVCVGIAVSGIIRQPAIHPPDAVMLILGLISGVLFIAGLVGMQSSIHQNGATLTAAFAKLGLIIPLAISILLYGERPHALQIIGLMLVFAAIFIIHPVDKGEKKDSPQAVRILPLVTVLMVCGSGDAMIKIFEHTGQADNGSMFFLVLFGSAGILTLVFLCLEYRKTGRGLYLPEFLAGMVVGVPNYFASALLLKALTKFPAFITYPSYSTGTILLVLIVSSLLFHERISRRTGAGLAVILAALVILNI